VRTSYDEQGNEFARGLTNFSSEEDHLDARNPEMEIEDVHRPTRPKRDCRCEKHFP